MPELPEVEIYKLYLDQSGLLGKRFRDYRIHGKSLRYHHNMPTTPQGTIQNITRHGKAIYMSLSNNYYFKIHLGMSGKIRVLPTSDLILRSHDHIEIMFDGLSIVYNDTRRFGYVTYTKSPYVCQGIDGLAYIKPDYFSDLCAKTGLSIRNLLMNQNHISGLGNIYVQEVLFKAKILPRRPANSLTSTEINKILCYIPTILNAAIQASGSTIATFTTPNGTQGGFKPAIYGRHHCSECQAHVIKVKAQQPIYYCPCCQK